MPNAPILAFSIDCGKFRTKPVINEKMRAKKVQIIIKHSGYCPRGICGYSKCWVYEFDNTPPPSFLFIKRKNEN